MTNLYEVTTDNEFGNYSFYFESPEQALEFYESYFCVSYPVIKEMSEETAKILLEETKVNLSDATKTGKLF